MVSESCSSWDRIIPFRDNCWYLGKLQVEEEVGKSLIVKEPVGVVNDNSMELAYKPNCLQSSSCFGSRMQWF